MDALLGTVLLLVVLALIGVVVAVVVMVLRRRKRDQGLADRARRVDPLSTAGGTSDPRNLKPGDIVRLSSEPGDWVVRGTIALEEDGFRWKEHLLDASGVDGEKRHWLSVEEDEGGLELALWDRLPGSDLSPDSAEVAHGGVAFTRDERGRARYSSTGTTGAAEAGEMDYVDYLPAGGGSARLGFERWSTTGAWEVSTGRLVGLESLEILHS